MEPFAALALHKKLLRQAATSARNELLALGGSVQTESMICVSVSRALYYQDIKLAQLLWGKHALARQHLGMRNGRLFLTSPAVFSDLIHNQSAELLGNKVAEQERLIMAENARAKPAVGQVQRCVERIKYLSRLSALYMPIHSKISVGALKVDHRLLHEPSAIASALSQAWLPTFTAQSNDMTVGHEVLCEAVKGNTWDWSLMRD
eukprot:6108305-Karenia_brevis.AAC.1